MLATRLGISKIFTPLTSGSRIISRPFHSSSPKFIEEIKEKKKFERTKPHFNVGTIGHVDHGKTTLTASITKLLAEKGLAVFRKYDEIDKSPEEKSRGITITASHIEYQTIKRHYAHIDCPGHQHYVKNMVTGAAQMEVAILVVSAQEGPQEQTREHIILSHEVGVPHVVLFMNKMDLIPDPEIVSIIEEELRELLTRYGHKGEEAKSVRGAAKLFLDDANDPSPYARPAMQQLMDVLDDLPFPERPKDVPFLMPIEDTFSILGRGTVVTGRIEQGSVKLNDELGVVGGKPIAKAGVIGIETFNKLLDSAEAGDNVGILLRNVKSTEVMRGDCVVKPNSFKTSTKFEGSVYILNEEEGGRKKPFTNKFQPQFFIRTADITGKLELPAGVDMAMPGDKMDLKVTLMHGTPLKNGLRFAIREGKATVGAGFIKRVMN